MDALREVRRHVQQARRHYGLAEQKTHTEVIAVSKGHALDAMQPLLDAPVEQGGCRHFGENRVQEAAKKWQAAKEQHVDLMLHMIGPLQTNKVRAAVQLFDVIHSLDRPKLAYALAEEMSRTARNIPCFIQVNIGNEAQKSGVDIADLEAFYRLCTEECGLPVVGLMCIPPSLAKGQVAGPYFMLLKQQCDALGLQQTSMGMSDDYRLGAAMGARYVRVGRAIFGARHTV